MAAIVLLGSQRLRPTLVRAVERVGVSGRIAAVTAGWQEREGEVDELSEHLGQEVVNLRLHGRSEELFAEDEELFLAYRRRQDRLHRLQELYRARLNHAMEAARDMLRRDGEAEVVLPEQEAAIAAVRALDDHHLQRLVEVHQAFETKWKLPRRRSVARHRRGLKAILGKCDALAIAGGHVAVLLNRLRLFDVVGALGDKPIFAWSGGAMVLGERLVLFHDSPPQGAGNAEILESGLGVFQGILPLPHARRRLRLEDPARVGLLARRFADLDCVALDDGGMLFLDGAQWTPGPDSRLLRTDGTVEELAAA